ncbi:hypothetical protein AVEN_101841-1, partial [Araneus ventricosus]
SRLLGRRVPGSKPDSIEDLPCMGPVERQIMRSGQTFSRWCGVEVWRGGASMSSKSTRRVLVVQNYEVCPKTALVLLRNGTLM